MSLIHPWQRRIMWVSIPLVAFLLHISFFVGYLASDDMLYMAQAQRYLDGNFAPPVTHWGFRYTVVLPLTLLGQYFDFTEPLLASVSLAYWYALIIAVAWFLHGEFGQPAALTGAILVATLPLFVVWSTILGVDITEALFLFMAFALFFRAESSPSFRATNYFFAGLCVGLAVLTRETAYGFLIVLGVFFIAGGYRRWRGYIAGLIGIAVVLFAEWTYYLVFDEGILYRFQAIAGSHGTIGIKSGDFTAGTGNVSHNRLIGPFAAILLNQEFALLYWFAIAAAFYVYRYGDERYRKLLGYVLVTGIVYFLWIGYSGAIRPLPRYFAFVSVLAVVLIAMMVISIKSWARRAVLMLLLLGANIAALSVENIYPRFSSKTVGEFAAQSFDPVVTDPRSAWQAKTFARILGMRQGEVVDYTNEINGPAIYAHVDGIEVPDWVARRLSDAELVLEKDPPKLLAGHVLDWTGIGTVLPERLYHYLAIRNPAVRFYRISADDTPPPYPGT